MALQVFVRDSLSSACDLRELVPYTAVTSTGGSATVTSSVDGVTGQPIYNVEVPLLGCYSASDTADGIANTVAGQVFVIDAGTDCEQVYINCSGTARLLNQKTKGLVTSVMALLVNTTVDSGGQQSVSYDVHANGVPECATHALFRAVVSVSGTGQANAAVQDVAAAGYGSATGVVVATTDGTHGDNTNTHILLLPIAGSDVSLSYLLDKGVSGAGGNFSVRFDLFGWEIL